MANGKSPQKPGSAYHEDHEVHEGWGMLVRTFKLFMTFMVKNPDVDGMCTMKSMRFMKGGGL
jgi:hypothetical protein